MKKSNQESLLNAGSLIITEENLPSSEVPSLYTCIRSLQRLKVYFFNCFEESVGS